MLSGTFDQFPLTEVLGLVERSAASGALVVRGREVDGCMYFAAGQLVGGEVADLAGPVEGRDDLETRVLEVCVALLRSRQADFEFRPDAMPPWPAAISTPIGPTLERAQGIAHDWPAIMSAVESFESLLERTGSISVPSITLTPIGFRVLELVDGATSIRELAHRSRASLIVVAPEVRTLILAGAVRVVVDADRALATARAGATESLALDGMLDVTEPGPEPAAVPDEPAVPPAESVPSAPEPVAAPVPEPVVVRVPEPVVVRVPEPVVAAAPVAPIVPAQRDPQPMQPVAMGSAGAPHLMASVASEVEILHPATDRDELARERADLASRAGLHDPGPVPDAGSGLPAEDSPDRAQIVVNRSDLLRMFSGLKDD